MLSGKWLSLVVFLLLCYGVAATASVLTRPAIRTWYVTLAKPSWAPPNWAFPVVWTFLYACMAVGGWLVWVQPSSAARSLALLLFGAQLVLNFLWSPVFFAWHRVGAGVVVIATLWLLLLAFLLSAWNLQRTAALLFVPYLVWVAVAAALNFSIWRLNARGSDPPRADAAVASALAPWAGSTATAMLFHGDVDPEGFPAPDTWLVAPPIHFHCDWQGRNPDPERATEVRLLWNAETLFLRFHCRFRFLTVFPDAEPSGRRDRLWERDVAEVFLQPDGHEPGRYLEFEISPNGMWIDLEITPAVKTNLQSGLRRRVGVNQREKAWVAELAIPMRALVENSSSPDSEGNHGPVETRDGKPWRVNFFRVEGVAEPRFYAAWRPTLTAIPNFHVPSAFGYLEFRTDS
jgi:tryptophan-rich sensory protein